MGEKVIIRDVSLRDGLQLTKTVVPLQHKVEWFRQLAGAGVSEVELTSFVSRDRLPQFADAIELLAEAKAIGGAKISTLCPSLNMARRALDAGTPQVNFVVSASETHQQANVGRSINQSLGELQAISAELDERGLRGRVALSVAVSMSFGCSFEGPVNPIHVMSMCERIVSTGVDELCLADTVGYATPGQIHDLFQSVSTLMPVGQLCGHFHDTYGTALANVTAALAIGVRRFDAASGGLGGCPFAPGASGNVATEDCAYLVEGLGFQTGISLPAIAQLVRSMRTWLPGERLPGRITNLGLPKSWRADQAVPVGTQQ